MESFSDLGLSHYAGSTGIIDPNVDKYFFERDFPMIYQKLCDKPKFLWWDLGNRISLHLLYDNENNKKINF